MFAVSESNTPSAAFACTCHMNQQSKIQEWHFIICLYICHTVCCLFQQVTYAPLSTLVLIWSYVLWDSHLKFCKSLIFVLLWKRWSINEPTKRNFPQWENILCLCHHIIVFKKNFMSNKTLTYNVFCINKTLQVLVLAVISLFMIVLCCAATHEIIHISELWE